MARKRSNKTKKFPQGLYEKKRNGKLVGYIFYRVDGSSKLFKDLIKAKRMAFDYNRTYRVDKELSHGIFKDAKEIKRHKIKSKPLSAYLKSMFDRVCADKQWKDTTLNVRKQQFLKINEHFKDILCSEVSLDDVNEFLAPFDGLKDHNRYNRYLYILDCVFKECVSQGYLENNPASLKVRKTIKGISSVERIRLTFDDFRSIHQRAGRNGDLWMQVAMELALQTCQGVNEVSFMKYKDIEDNFIKVIRRKTETNEASHVKIPLSVELMKILQRSKSDSILSPYVVHRQRDKRYRNRKLGKEITHETQVPKNKISREFSKLRDELGIQKHINKDNRSGFHDIRALAIHWLSSNGHKDKVQTRAAHADAKSTKLYEQGHIDWQIAEDVTIEWQHTG